MLTFRRIMQKTQISENAHSHDYLRVLPSTQNTRISLSIWLDTHGIPDYQTQESPHSARNAKYADAHDSIRRFEPSPAGLVMFMLSDTFNAYLQNITPCFNTLRFEF